jgi:hypothetical protein
MRKGDRAAAGTEIEHVRVSRPSGKRAKANARPDTSVSGRGTSTAGVIFSGMNQNSRTPVM